MNIPFPIKCRECKTKKSFIITSEVSNFEFICTCGARYPIFLQNSITIGTKLLQRSQYEIESNNDFSLSIIFSATAVECELSRLYKKWRRIIELKKSSGFSEISENALEIELRKNNQILKKIKQTSILMDENGFDDFVKKSPEIKNTIDQKYPSLDSNNLSESIQEKVFWIRNRIIHMGKTNYSKIDAIRCLNISSLCVYILKEMDKEKRKNI
jgi:hypothetical protein